ncbi:hypothetical protein ACSBOB_13600 [Mesorhizobium sp. ASY16-5R]|uniref:hypothetical protein n=1 Tax=Mesorhizobium sp. ASY16-5R TaxID=3445772 RepID=UPI003FA0EBAB
MPKILKGWSKGLALVAAALFLVQSLSGGFAVAAGNIPLDAFGNPLCITSSDHGTPADRSDHGKMPGCCMLGCTAAAMVVGAPPTGTSLAVAFQTGIAARRPMGRTIVVQADDHPPGSPRAPPAIG